MPLEKLSLGATPAEEPCAQVGEDGYDLLALRECRAYTGQLARIVLNYLSAEGKEIPPSFRISVKASPHDFGTYHEVFACFDIDDIEAVDLAFYLEHHAPGFWDEEAKTELGLKG